MTESNKFFQEALEGNSPPSGWSLALQSLWYAANDNWEASHNIAQDLNTPAGSWIHAHLHRVEGDEFNASYWYRKAGKQFSSLPFKDEINEIVDEILKHE